MKNQANKKKVASKEKNSKVTGENLTDYIIRFEDNTLTDAETIELFSYLVSTKLCYHLQGSYGRYAEDLIEAGYLDREGCVLKYKDVVKK